MDVYSPDHGMPIVSKNVDIGNLGRMRHSRPFTNISVAQVLWMGKGGAQQTHCIMWINNYRWEFHRGKH